MIFETLLARIWTGWTRKCFFEKTAENWNIMRRSNVSTYIFCCCTAEFGGIKTEKLSCQHINLKVKHRHKLLRSALLRLYCFDWSIMACTPLCPSLSAESKLTMRICVGWRCRNSTCIKKIPKLNVLAFLRGLETWWHLKELNYQVAQGMT